MDIINLSGKSLVSQIIRYAGKVGLEINAEKKTKLIKHFVLLMSMSSAIFIIINQKLVNHWVA